MNKIRYGNPNFDNSLTLTPEHLLYREGDELPVIADEIEIGDVLIGVTNYTNYLYQMYYVVNDYNYTVYDIANNVYKTPINPITNSGKVMVNGIQTSVYSYSVEEHDRLHRAGAIFRWISDNINEELSVKLIEFSYRTVYKQLMNETMRSLVFCGTISSAIFVIAVPVVFIYIIKGILRKLFKMPSFKMKIQ